MTLLNTDYRGIADFAEQNEAYVAFLKEFHRRLAGAGKVPRFRRGNTPIGYAVNIGFCLFSVAGLAFILWMLPVLDTGWLVSVKLGVVLFFLPVLVRYMQRATPGSYDPLDLPADVLPPV